MEKIPDSSSMSHDHLLAPMVCAGFEQMPIGEARGGCGGLHLEPCCPPFPHSNLVGARGILKESRHPRASPSGADLYEPFHRINVPWAEL